MQKNWYVVANENGGLVTRLRIVAGPLTKEAATEEAQLRIRRKTGDIHFAIVEFDPFYGMNRKQQSQ